MTNATKSPAEEFLCVLEDAICDGLDKYSGYAGDMMTIEVAERIFEFLETRKSEISQILLTVPLILKQRHRW